MRLSEIPITAVKCFGLSKYLKKLQKNQFTQDYYSLGSD